MNKARVSKSGGKHGAVLVITLLLIVVLAVATVAFMQNTSTDRQTARSIGNHYRAQLAAEAGAAAATAMVADLITRYPDSATAWQNIGGGAANGTSNEATVFYFRAKGADSNLGASPAEFGANVRLWSQPLVSRTSTPTTLNTAPVALDTIAASVPVINGVTTNLNATNAVWTEPFIGSRTTTNPGAPVTAAQWVYITKFGGPTDATNPYVARYAFWIEDESFKVNVNVATHGPRGVTSLGITPEEIRVDGAWRASTNASLANANTAATINARSGFGASGYPTVQSAALVALSNVANFSSVSELRFYTTANSAGLDLSRGGFKRVSINSITNGIDSPTNTNTIRANLNRIIAAITNTNASPLFGQRFYRLSLDASDVNATNVVSPNHEAIYLNKIAVNILDYIDDNSQPTIVNNDEFFSIRVGRPNEALLPLGDGLQGTNALAAVGVENIPYLYGYGVHARLLSMDPVGYNTNSTPPTANRRAQFEFSVDHYLEFWNMGVRPIEFGEGSALGVDYLPDVFLSIANAPGWGTSTTGQPALEGFARGDRDYKAAIPDGVRVPAGGSVLFTTAPLEEAQLVATNAQQIVSLNWPDDKRKFSGETRYVVSATNANLDFNRLYAVRRVHSGRQGTQLDAETEILMGNEFGIIQTFPYGTVSTRNLMVTNDLVLDSDRFFINRGSLRGNRPAANVAALAPGVPQSQVGDPRTLNEQLLLLDHASDGGGDHSKFYTDVAVELLGAPNTRWVDAAAWVDYSTMSPGAALAPMVVANQSVNAISELGHIFDPARPPAVAPSGVVYSRGGGRTFRIGQPELSSWYDGDQTNASRTWASWRLADIFTTTNAVTINGLINPNGVLRDGGLALQAALNGLTYLDSPEGAPNTAGTALNSNNINVLLTNIISRMTNTNSYNPVGALNLFWERGEISELSILNAGTDLLGGGINLSDTIDRGREELVRRSMQMLTTRGSVFTAYVIGQSLQTTSTSTNVTSTTRLRQMFQLEPNGLNVNDSFNPADSVDISARFSKPSRYDVRILRTSYD
jgi:hypothetical protein